MSRVALGSLAAGQASSHQVRSASTNYDYVVNGLTFFSSAHAESFRDIDSRDFSIEMQSIEGNKLPERVIEDWLDRSAMIVAGD